MLWKGTLGREMPDTSTTAMTAWLSGHTHAHLYITIPGGRPSMLTSSNCIKLYQTAKMAETPGTRQTPVKCEFSTDQFCFFDMRRKMSPGSIAYHEIRPDHFSTSSSSHAHSERTLECAGLGHGLASAWSEVGNKSS